MELFLHVRRDFLGMMAHHEPVDRLVKASLTGMIRISRRLSTGAVRADYQK